ncbi:MAG: hypothetical protein BMS9Abin07_1991 [Acidimicrobiia bacterium]|nr:MAG: hypothetical protein BMS9Abin07_1991 [Acidimicrobiia bacterium]
MNRIFRLAGLEGAAEASGPTVVIDTFRAFSTAAYLLDAGVARLILTDGLDEARRIAAALDDVLLCGEDGSKPPDDFDLGNSPTEVLQRTDLPGRTVVMRTSAGTRCVAAAVAGGARPVYAASLVVAGATASALADEPTITLVSSGGSVDVPHDEDEYTGDLIAGIVAGRTPDYAAVLVAVRAGTGTARLRRTPWIDDRDIDRCLVVDTFDFAMEASVSDGLLTLSAN